MNARSRIQNRRRTSDPRRGERQNKYSCGFRNKKMKIVADFAGQEDWDFVVAIGNCET